MVCRQTTVAQVSRKSHFRCLGNFYLELQLNPDAAGRRPSNLGALAQLESFAPTSVGKPPVHGFFHYREKIMPMSLSPMSRPAIDHSQFPS
jgi:hypothetical protein